jgi:hypothetical protein
VHKYSEYSPQGQGPVCLLLTAKISPTPLETVSDREAIEKREGALTCSKEISLDEK